MEIVPKKQSKQDSQKVKLVDVIPITKGLNKEQLTYFTLKEVVSGAMVSVPLRNKYVNAIVISIEDAYLSKSQLRSSSFPIKKIQSVKLNLFLSPSFIVASKETAKYFACATGSVISDLLPSAISSACKEDIYTKKSEQPNSPKNKKITESKQQVYLIQAEDDERISSYKSIIREEFAKRSSVFFCLPEINEIEHITKILSRGIEGYTYVLHGSMPKKMIIELWNKALKEPHPILIIATGQFLSLPRKDISIIILEKESARSYKRKKRPYLDIRVFAEMLAKESKSKIIIGDIFLRPETIFRLKEGNATEFSPLKFRSLSTAKQAVIDMKGYTSTSNTKRFPIISGELKNILDNHKNNESTFMLTARRGLYPTTICNDCGSTVLCEKCSAPTVLHKARKGSNLSYCHKCGLKQNASDKCSNCGSWRLATLGVGIEYVEEELKREFPNLTIFRLDKDNAKTHKKAKEIINKFYANTGSVLLGTEMSVPYLTKKIDNVVVVSVDSLFTIPDFRINERVFNLLLRLRAKATKNFLIQTRDIENKVFEYTTKGNMADFYRGEISERKILKYPPFSKLVKISLEGKKNVVEKEMTKLEKKLTDYSPTVYPAFIHTIKEKYRMNILLKLKPGGWQDEKILNLLLSLPPSFAIRVDPEDVL